MLVERAQQMLAAAGDGSMDPDRLRVIVQNFLGAAPGAPEADIAGALSILGSAYALQHSDGKLTVLSAAGYLIESGADPAPLVVPTLDFLQRQTPLASAFQDACAAQIPADTDDPDEAFRRAASLLRSSMPEAAEAWAELEALYVPVISILAASPAARAQGRALASSMDKLREYNGGASWLWPMLMVLDQEPMLVIEPETRLGLIGKISGVSSNFQLHVLLMNVFPQSGRESGPRLSRKAADVARGNIPEQRAEETITGHWNMHAWTALRGTDKLSTDHSEASIRHWIWNEGVPADIPVFDGYRVILLGPPSYERLFASQRDFRTLRADIDVERLLSSNEVNAWIERFSQASPM